MTVMMMILLMLLPMSAEARTACQEAKGADGYWAWRNIDGKRCWYPGKRRVAKAQLYWPAEELPPAPPERPRPSLPPSYKMSPVSRLLFAWTFPITIASATASSNAAFAPPDSIHTFKWDEGEAWDPPAKKEDSLTMAEPASTKTIKYVPPRLPQWGRVAVLITVFVISAGIVCAVLSIHLTTANRRNTYA